MGVVGTGYIAVSPLALAGQHDGDLAVEGHALFQHAGLTVELSPCRCQLVVCERRVT